MKHPYYILGLAAALAVATPSFAQNDGDRNDGKYNPTVSGSIQSDMLAPTGSQSDGSHEDFRTNTFVDLNVMSKYIDAGARFEYREHQLPGYDAAFKGYGVPYVYLKAKLKNFEVTVGNFYEQFGSGFVLRTYEERSLGIDNSLLGARIVTTPVKGVRLKALTGQQRRYWAHNDSWVSGADVELSLDSWFKGLAQSGTSLTLGGSFVNKNERNDEDVFNGNYRLVMPRNVNAWDARVTLNTHGFNVLAEYAQKTADPSFKNNYIYRKGTAAMLSASYSKKGFSVLAQAKRSDNFFFNSYRGESLAQSTINHLPAFTMDQTYALAALYPYGTRLDGEWAYQGQLGYKFKRKTAIGGKYGMMVKVNFSHVRGIDQNPRSLTVNVPEPTVLTGKGTDGYGSAFWKWGKSGMCYQDLNVQIDRRFTRDFKLSLMYMNQFYNKTIVEGEGGMIHSNIFIADALFNLSPKTRLRTELQYLTTGEDEHDWLFALAELSLVPHWMFTVSDQYNVGLTDAHYWQTFVTYNTGAHRVQLGWGRTRAGFNCSGGVCRYVPETKGFTLSYNYNF